MSTFLFVVLELIDDTLIFIIVSFVARSLQGVSVELINIVVFSLATLITDNTSEEKSKNLSLVESATSLGLIFGPFLAFIFGYFGYVCPFIASIGLDIVSLLLLQVYVQPEEKVEEELGHWRYRSLSFDPLNTTLKRQSISYIEQLNEVKYYFEKDDEEADESEEDEDWDCLSEPIKKRETYYTKFNFVYKKEVESSYETQMDAIGFISLAFSSSIFPTLMTVLLDYICQTFFQPVFTIVMKRQYNLTEQQSSLILSVMFLCYFISLRYINTFIKIFPVKYLLCFGLLINSIASMLFNPIHSLPQELWISILGYCLLNCFAGFISITSIIDLHRSLRLKGYSNDFASDNSSALYIFAINIAELFGPTLGGVLTASYGFEITCAVVGIGNLSVSILYFLLNFRKINSSLHQKYKKHFK